MDSVKQPPTGLKTKGRALVSLALALPMALILLALLTQGDRSFFTQPDRLFAFAATWLLDIFLFYKMLYTGKTDKWRAALFVLFAVTLCIAFISNMTELRGTRTFNGADVLECKIPFCHIVTTMILIPLALSRSIIFPGTIEGGFADISSMLVIVFGGLIILGRGFCAWGCFYGGWEDGMSRIRKTAIWKTPPAYLRWGGFAVLILVALTSAATLVPTYCDWLCPFKAVTEYNSPTDFISFIQFVIFVSIFVGLVIVLPFLTRKRTQCAWFCPMGAFNSLFNKINAWDIRIDKDKCVKCGKCVKNCPVFALDSDALEEGAAHIQCVKCGRCADDCPRGAIGYHLRFTQVLKHPTTARVLFLYASFGFLAVFSSGSIQQAILAVLKLLANWSV
jgi:ferredoxin-type protein NapH